MNFENLIAERKNKKIYHDGDRVYKIFNEEFSKANVLNEALNQARVEETGLNIPKIYEVTVIEGKWTIVSEFIEGVTLKQLMQENPDKLDEYMEFFVDLQLKMHSMVCRGLNKIQDKMSMKIDQADLSDTTKYELHTLLEGMPKHKKLCHGDYNPSNIIIKPDGTPYILDWSHATQGNASADVARTYLLFCLKNGEDIANKYLDLFCEKSQTDRRYVQKWMPIVAASQSVKGNKEEREFLLSWADIVDYE